MNHAQVLEDLLSYALFSDKEWETPETVQWQGNNIPRDAAVSQGVMTSFVFHPGRLQEKAGEIIALARTIVDDEFFVGKGEGWSFLNLITTRDGVHWAEHPTVERLICICNALGLAGYVLPRKMWEMFPGGLPYVWFDLDAPPTPQRVEYPKSFEKWKDTDGIIWTIGYVRGDDVAINTGRGETLRQQHRKVGEFGGWTRT